MKKAILNVQTFSIGLTTVFVAIVGVLAYATEKAKVPPHDGEVVSITNSTLVTTGRRRTDRKEWSHSLAKGAKVTVDGKECKASDLKSGMRVRITTQRDDQSVATHIEGIDKNLDFASVGHGDSRTFWSASLIQLAITEA